MIKLFPLLVCFICLSFSAVTAQDYIYSYLNCDVDIIELCNATCGDYKVTLMGNGDIELFPLSL